MDQGSRIWGFHVHQEVTEAEFPRALALQKRHRAFLDANTIPVDAADAIAPGYGPHLDWMWELRVESNPSETVLENLGLCIGFMALNRHGLSGYIHPCMHDEQKPALEALREEGETNQVEAIWFTKRVAQKQEFFFEPPLDDRGGIADTRTARVVAPEALAEMRARGEAELTQAGLGPSDPQRIRGWRVHLDFPEPDREQALRVKEGLLEVLAQATLAPEGRSYGPRERRPHVQAGWQVAWDVPPGQVSSIGLAMGWLMCNRRGLSVFAVPLLEETSEEEVYAQYAFFIGQPPALDWAAEPAA